MERAMEWFSILGWQIGVVRFEMADSDLTPRLTRAGSLEALLLMNLYVETSVDLQKRMLTVVECDMRLTETVQWHMSQMFTRCLDAWFFYNLQRNWATIMSQLDCKWQTRSAIAMIVEASLSTIRRRMTFYGLFVCILIWVTMCYIWSGKRNLHCLSQLGFQDDGRTPPQSRVQITSSAH